MALTEIAPEHLTKWITRMMADLTEEGLPQRFELFHTVDGSAERLSICRVKEGSDASDIAQTLYDEARNDMDTRTGGHQRYTVALFRSENQSEPEVQFPFRLQPRIGSAWTGGDTEQPTEKGERAQQMRMTNDMHNMMMRYAGTLGGQLSEALEKERAERQRLEEKLSKQAAEFEDLQDRRLERQLMRDERIARDKMLLDVVGSLTPIIPIVAGKLLGGLMKDKNGHESPAAKALIPADAEARSREVLLKELFSNLSDEEKKGLFGALKPMHRIALFEVGGAAEKITDDLSRATFDKAMQKFLKSLDPKEVMGIMSALDQGNRNRFMIVYNSYGEIEASEQEGLPDLMKDQPPSTTETA